MQKANEIVSLEAFRQPTESYDEQNMGWREIVQVVVQMTSPAASLPHDYYASGQVCRYDIGSGGIVTTKSPCKKICDFDTSSKGPAFRRVPATETLGLAAN